MTIVKDKFVLHIAMQCKEFVSKAHRWSGSQTMQSLSIQDTMIYNVAALSKWK